MLSRRHLRVKVLQSLYAYYQSETKNLELGEKQLLKNAESFHQLYLYNLAFLRDLCAFSRTYAENQKTKFLESNKAKNTSTKLAENLFVKALDEADILNGLETKMHGFGDDRTDLIRNLFMLITKEKEYEDYTKSPKNDLKSDSDFILFIINQFLAPSETFDSLLEDTVILWESDKDLIVDTLKRTVRNFVKSNGELSITPISKDWKTDQKFILELFQKSILENEKLTQLVDEKTQNWDIDRIAKMDILIIKVAIIELIHFSNIPIKVSINEYIEIAKNYSTPKSKIFVNGILDKISKELKEKGEIKKFGRGLME